MCLVSRLAGSQGVWSLFWDWALSTHIRQKTLHSSTRDYYLSMRLGDYYSSMHLICALATWIRTHPSIATHQRTFLTFDILFHPFHKYNSTRHMMWSFCLYLTGLEQGGGGDEVVTLPDYSVGWFYPSDYGGLILPRWLFSRRREYISPPFAAIPLLQSVKKICSSYWSKRL